jgi:pimeloyl-ACP methyl ester carboxylesterase
MAEPNFAQRRSGAGLPYREAGAGETVVAILGGGGPPTQAHALLAEHRHVLAFAMSAAAGTPREAARRIAAALADLGVARFDLLAEGAGAATALWLAMEPEPEIGAVVLAAPSGQTDDAFRAITRPLLVLAGTKDPADAERWRALLPDGNFMFVYDAGAAIGAERPQAFAYIAREFFERRHLFLVSRENGVLLP